MKYEVIEIPDPDRDLNKVAEKLAEIKDLKQVIYIEYARLRLNVKVAEHSLYSGVKWPVFEEQWGWRILVAREANEGEN